MKEINDKIELPAVKDNFHKFIEFIETNLTILDFEQSEKMKILMACEEIIINVINYAYADLKGSLGISFVSNSLGIEMTFIDSGRKFNPLEKPDADVTLSLDKRTAGGLGIYMVKKLMDNISYEYIQNQNRLIVFKKILQ